MTSDKSKRHHYIPQSVLENFVSNKMIWWHSKSLGKKGRQKVREVGFRYHFYKYPDSEKSLETDFFRVIDNNAPVVIKKIIDAESINLLSVNDKDNLVRYIASQLVRTPNVINSMSDFECVLKDQIHNDLTMIKEDLKTDYLNSIVFNTSIYEGILKDKLFFLHETAENNSFIIGDSPVLSFSKKGNKDFNVLYHGFPPVVKDDIYIFPISDRFLLIFINNDISLLEDVFFYMSRHNDFQFINSFDRVFSKSEEVLNVELKKYNLNCYDFADFHDPSFIKKFGLKRGEPLVILPAVIKLDEKTREVLKNDYIESLTVV